MWVWIPRYVYRITNGWHSNSTGTIEVKFSKGIDDTIDGTVSLVNKGKATDSNGTWTSHPAFTFGETELTGIWVAKYEATAAEGEGNNSSSDNVSSKTVKIIPNVESWRYINTGNAFTVARKMESNSVYGWATASGLKADATYTTDTNNIDTHLMKNSEWGAVAYLSKSQYGKNTEEIWINNDRNYTTGCAADSVSQGVNDGCLNTYESTNGVKASTTGNIYGIYDMSGNSWERVSAYVDNGHSNLVGQGSSIIKAESKYKDIYTTGSTDEQVNNYGLAINKKGDAVYETSSNGIASSLGWFNDYTNTPTAGDPWFARGGHWADVFVAGAFGFHFTGGHPRSSHGFRPVLLVNAGL
jgi:hypothetical protein